MGVDPPLIGSVSASVARPLWSVMIPTYNCARYLEQTLTSVLFQDRGPDNMQIEVVDDRSNSDNPEAVVKGIGGGRVHFHRNAANEGAIGNFNTCINRARGHMVHILHGDDFVAEGYYREIEELAAKHPEVGLYATRCFYVDEESVITGVSDRIRDLEQPARSARPFFYITPLQFASVTVRRTCYEELGGFRFDLKHVADCEMWARICGARGGVVSANIMASYRAFAGNDTARLSKTAENIQDICRINEIFAERYPEFSTVTARARVSGLAWQQYRRFRSLGDDAAAEANWKLWTQVTPKPGRIARQFRSWAGPFVRRLMVGGQV
jgi:glycosyltransferase involved in cell wall biosynthesis